MNRILTIFLVVTIVFSYASATDEGFAQADAYAGPQQSQVPIQPVQNRGFAAPYAYKQPQEDSLNLARNKKFSTILLAQNNLFLAYNPQNAARQPQLTTLNSREPLTNEALSNSTCDLGSNFLYKGFCINKTCLADKISRINLAPVDPILSNNGTLSIGIYGEAQVVNLGQSDFQYSVKVSYDDQQDNQIVSDPYNCIDWRLYKTVNEYEIDPTRQFVNNEGDNPVWPVSQYQFNNVSNRAEISFNLTQDDLNSKKCYSYQIEGKQYWECFFELSFTVKGVTQVSYYFCIKVCLNTNVAAAVPAVNFLKIIQIDRCPPEGQCTVDITVKSSLDFCNDANCAQHQNIPYFLLFLNRPFWMRYQINDAAFQQYLINNETLTYQSAGLVLKLTQNDTDSFKVLSRNPGYNIIQLRVPIVSQEVIVSINGKITAPSVRLLQEQQTFSNQKTDESYIARAQRSVGAVLDAAGAVNNAYGEVSKEASGYLITIGLVLLIIII